MINQDRANQLSSVFYTVTDISKPMDNIPHRINHPLGLTDDEISYIEDRARFLAASAALDHRLRKLYEGDGRFSMVLFVISKGATGPNPLIKP